MTDIDAVHAMVDDVAYLASDDAAFGSGLVLSVSGGLTMAI